MANPTPSLLDGAQIIKRVYHEATDAVRVEVASGTSFAVSLDSTDSVVALGTENGAAGGTAHALKVDASGIQYTRGSILSSASSVVTSTTSGTILGPITCDGIVNFQIFGVILSTAVIGGTGGEIDVSLEISPSSSGTVFYTTPIVFTFNAGVLANFADATILLNTLVSGIVGRARLVITTNNLSAGDTAQFTLLGNTL